MTQRKSKIISFLLWCTLAALLTIGFFQSAAIGQFPTVSLRYQSPITGEAAYRARQHAIAAASADAHNTPFWPTFWHQHRAQLSTAGNLPRAANIPVISFSGDAGLVWHAQYLAGSAPSSVDGSGIAVSHALAHRLWGSTDIIGMHVYVDGARRTVRGVFEGAGELALLSFHIEDRAPSWTAVELAGGGAHPTRGQAQSFALQAGLGMPDYILTSGAGAVARALALLPLLAPAIYALALLVGYVKTHYPGAAVPLCLGGLVLFAAALPFLLHFLPDWAIPTLWSDFTFWSGMQSQAAAGLREFLSAPPALRDVELKMRLLQLTGVAVLSLCVGIVACATWHQRRQMIQ